MGVETDAVDCEGVINEGQPPPVRVRDVPDVDASNGASLLLRPKLRPVLLVRRLRAPRSSTTT